MNAALLQTMPAHASTYSPCDMARGLADFDRFMARFGSHLTARVVHRVVALLVDAKVDESITGVLIEAARDIEDIADELDEEGERL